MYSLFTSYHYSIRFVSTCDHPLPKLNNNEQNVGVILIQHERILHEEQKVYNLVNKQQLL